MAFPHIFNSLCLWFITFSNYTKKANLKDKQEITFGISNGVCLHSAFISRGLFLLMEKGKANKTAKNWNKKT